MIDPKELIIGNWLLCVHEDTSEDPVKVVSLTEDGFTARGDEVYPGKDDEFAGIPITTEILEKCGFERHKNLNSDEWWFDDLVIEAGDGGFKLFGSEWTIGNAFYFLHQLQNLHFILFGQDLEVKL